MIVNIKDNIIHLEYPNYKELTLSFFRISEFSESPYEDVRYKHFNIETFLDNYIQDNGKINFFEYWNGFNINDKILTLFFNTFSESELTKRELEIYKVISPYFGENFYLIGSITDDKESAFDHEMIHAKYCLNHEYRSRVNGIIEEFDSYTFKSCKDNLISMGYVEDYDLIIDEINAYFVTEKVKSLQKMFELQDKELVRKYRKKLKSLL